jgi:alcohol dehydrogenase
MTPIAIRGAVLDGLTNQRPYDQTQPLSVDALVLDPPRASEVLVRIEAAGVCHSDLSVIDGRRARPLPMVLGHEAAGRVLACGSDVNDLSEGQRVVMTFLPRCGECPGCATAGRLPCVVGSASNSSGSMIAGGSRLSRDGEALHHHLGVSAFATHCVVDRRSVVPIDDDVPPEVAAVLGCAVVTGGGALTNAGRPQAGDDVIVVGLGGVGMAAVLTGLALECGRVIGVDTSLAKLEAARQLGADDAVTPEEAMSRGLGASVVVEAAGHPHAFETAFALTAPGGRTVTTGLPGPLELASVSPLRMTSEARTVIGSYLGSAIPARDIPRYVNLWRTGRLPVEKLISRRLRLDAVNDAMERLAAGTELRQIIDLGDG